MKHLNFKITIVILSTIFAGYFSATSANAIIIGGGGGQTYDPATNVTTTLITATSASISWDQPAANPPTTTYRIAKQSDINISLGDTVNNNIQIHNLIPDTDYDLNIETLDDSGQISSMTQIETFHTLAQNIPTVTSPTSFITTASTSNSIFLQWDTNNSAIGTVYQISGDNFATTTATSTGTGTMTANISGLSLNSQYTFNLQSRNNDGSLNPIVSVSDYTKTANPTNLATSNITTSTLTLSWDSNGNPSTTIYVVNYASTSINVSSTAINIDSLTPSTSYTFNIASTNHDSTSNSASSIITTTQTDSTSNNGAGGGNGGGGNSNISITSGQINDSVNKLIAFLKANQDADGKIIDGGISDWAAMAFGSKNIYASDVKNGGKSLYDFIYNYNFTDASDINSCASYSRHILALLSAGTAVSDNKITDIKNKVDSHCVTNGKFGEDGINDDVFGVLALMSVGEDASSPAVTAAVNGIKADQQADGSFTWSGWPGADITGAAINALKYAQNKGATVDNSIFDKAKQYLKSQQLADGGWGFGASDALTTGWVVMGINSLGETQTDWFTNTGKNPWYILTTLNNDHYIQSWDNGIDWFGTKHAVPALLGKTWPIILTPKPIPSLPVSSGSSNFYIPTTTPTSTIAVSTSTIVTTTLSTISTTSTVSSSIMISTTSTDTTSTTTTTKEPTIPTLKNKTVVTKKNTAQPKIVEANNTETNLSSGPTSTNKTQLVDDLPLDTPTKRAMKKLLTVSGGGVLAIGFWLGRKLIKKVI